MASYLDSNGVQKLWERMKEYVYNCRQDVGYKCMDDEVVTDECFEKAVRSVVDGGTASPLQVALDKNLTETNCQNSEFAHTDKTYVEIGTALLAGRNVGFTEPSGRTYMVTAVDTTEQLIGIYAYDANGEKLCWFRVVGDGTMEYPICNI